MNEIEGLLKQILDELKRISAPPPGPLLNYPQTAISIATATRPDSPDALANAAAGQPGYDRIVVFNEVHRLANRFYVVNDGSGTLYAICSSDGIKWSGESEILLHEAREFNNVYEIRVRSPDAGNHYRATEYRPSSTT